MKRLLLLALLMVMLVACGASDTPDSGAFDSSEPEIVTESASEPASARMSAAGAEAPAEEPMAEAPQSDGSVVETTGEAGAGAAQVLGNRKIIYNATLTIEIDDPRLAAQRMQALAASYGGFVSHANVFEQGEDRYVASIQLRVPSGRFDSLMGERRELGNEVRSESISTQDVTAEFADVEARIRNLERTEIELQALLTEARENSQKTEEVLRVYNEMNNVRGQIERLQGQLNVMADSVDLATITLELVPPPVVPDPIKIVDNEWAYSEVFREALRGLTEGLQVLATVATYVVVTLLPLGLILGGLGLAIIWLFRRVLVSAIQATRSATPPAAPAPATPPAPPTPAQE